MKKWWTAPAGVEIDWGNKLKDGKLGGVSPNEEVDNHTVTAYITSAYSGKRVPRYNLSPFKLSAGVTLHSIKKTDKENMLFDSESHKKAKDFINKLIK